MRPMAFAGVGSCSSLCAAFATAACAATSHTGLMHNTSSLRRSSTTTGQQNAGCDGRPTHVVSHALPASPCSWCLHQVPYHQQLRALGEAVVLTFQPPQCQSAVLC